MKTRSVFCQSDNSRRCNFLKSKEVMNENTSYLCRLCLKSSIFSFSLFAGNLVEKVEALAFIKINKNDELPQTCCESCVANVFTSYKFQQCIIESDKYLRDSVLQNESHIIEHAKQAPDLFEVLHDDTPLNDININVKEVVESKVENEVADQNGDYKCVYKTEQGKILPANTVKDPIFKNVAADVPAMQSTVYSSDSEFLCSESNVEYSFIDTLPTLNLDEDVEIFNDLADKEEQKKPSSIDEGVITHTKDMQCNDLEINKELVVKDKCKMKATVCSQKPQINSEDDSLDLTNVGDVLIKLGIQTKFMEKFAVYHEKRKTTQTLLECVECNSKFETKRLLKRHMIKHKLEKCPTCDTTMRRDNLKKHMQIHTDSPEICEICGKITKNKESLRGHLNYQHKNMEIIKCEACNREFKSNQHYKSHYRKVHLGIKNHQCDVCGKKFFANHDLKKHINMTHKGARPYICQYCKKGFCSPYARKTHLLVHTHETPYRCEICAAGFRQKVSLVTHMKSKHSFDKLEDKNSDNLI